MRVIRLNQFVASCVFVDSITGDIAVYQRSVEPSCDGLSWVGSWRRYFFDKPDGGEWESSMPSGNLVIFPTSDVAKLREWLRFRG